jgi:LPS sulfotransferase NodH
MTEAPDRYPTRYERGILKKADQWLGGLLAGEGEAPPEDLTPPAADPRLILLCMTPRSGSTALSAALASTGLLGLGGERLNRKNRTLNQIALETRPRTRRQLIERVIEASRTDNGVAQIKCDLPQVLPFLLDPACNAVLACAKFVYLTRGDLLGQAISRHRSTSVGVAHAKGKRAEARSDSRKEAAYSFTDIATQLDHLSRMMAGYEKVFAFLGIQPLRLTYETITADTGRAVQDIARLVGVEIAPGAISGLDAGGYKKVSGSNNDALRQAFLAEAPRHVLTPGHAARGARRAARGGQTDGNE